MAAPKGNQFWKIRSKHGTDKIFSTPELLWEAATEYFEWCDANPLKSYEWNGKDPVKCDLDKMRAYTLKGLCIYLDCNEELISQYEKYEGFLGVCSRIRNIIFTQKFEGAAAGLLNHNIIARELGLQDNKLVEITSDMVIAGKKFAQSNENNP